MNDFLLSVSLICLLLLLFHPLVSSLPSSSSRSHSFGKRQARVVSIVVLSLSLSLFMYPSFILPYFLFLFSVLFLMPSLPWTLERQVLDPFVDSFPRRLNSRVFLCCVLLECSINSSFLRLHCNLLFLSLGIVYTQFPCDYQTGSRRRVREKSCSHPSSSFEEEEKVIFPFSLTRNKRLYVALLPPPSHVFTIR